MNLTVGDLCSLPRLKGMRLIAGSGGLDREVNGCGILDYEYDSAVIEKYSNTNFHSGQLVLTSFLYARNNEYLVMDAVKKLISRGCSGLAVKNIFRLPLHENLLRYADSMKFPIFLIENPQLYFEDMIFHIRLQAQQYADFYHRSEMAAALLALPADATDCRRLDLARELSPSLSPDFYVLAYEEEGSFCPSQYDEIERRYLDAGILSSKDCIFSYENGFLLIRSHDTYAPVNLGEAGELLLMPAGSARFHAGISKLHHSLTELAEAIRESLTAKKVHRITEAADACLGYDETGVYQILVPFAAQPQLRQFSDAYIRPLADYDAENKTALLPTAVRFILCGGSIDKTAEFLNQHKNTVRYRIERISRLCGVNVLRSEHYEKLSLAVKIHLCQ